MCLYIVTVVIKLMLEPNQYIYICGIYVKKMESDEICI